MESKVKARVKSPSREAYYHLREGNGYSLAEIKEAKKSIDLLKRLNVKIDYFRKSKHDFNVADLKKLKEPEKKGKKREPFVKKEKKRTPFKPKEAKKKRKKTPVKKPVKKKPIPKAKTPVKEKTIKVKKPEIKEKVPKKEKIEITEKIPPKEKIAIEEGNTSLTLLTGLGATTANKFQQIGVKSVEDLINEEPEELAKLIKGASAVRISTWIKEGKKILEDSK